MREYPDYGMPWCPGSSGQLRPGIGTFRLGRISIPPRAFPGGSDPRGKKLPNPGLPPPRPRVVRNVLPVDRHRRLVSNYLPVVTRRDEIAWAKLHFLSVVKAHTPSDPKLGIQHGGLALKHFAEQTQARLSEYVHSGGRCGHER